MNQISLVFFSLLAIDVVIHIVLQQKRAAVLITKPLLMPGG